MASGVRVVLLGPPGAGKGTQTQLLTEQFQACHISTGDILRKAVQDQTPLGKEAASFINQGALVPDKLIVDLVGEKLKEKECEVGFVLDGFPRTIAQAESLDTILADRNITLDCVLSVQVPRADIVERLAGRRTCKDCKALFHIAFDPPKQVGKCNRCGGELFQRDDDREDTIMRRLEVYDSQTAPLVEYYRKRGMLRELDGVGKIDEIRARVLKALEGPVT